MDVEWDNVRSTLNAVVATEGAQMTINSTCTALLECKNQIQGHLFQLNEDSPLSHKIGKLFLL